MTCPNCSCTSYFLQMHLLIMSRITPMKPPGGDCHLVVGGMEAAEAAPELAVSPAPAPDKASCRVTQPPGGSATKLFDQETPAPGTPPPAKPYRCFTAIILLHISQCVTAG